jgi:hypothetical protein
MGPKKTVTAQLKAGIRKDTAFLRSRKYPLFLNWHQEIF